MGGGRAVEQSDIDGHCIEQVEGEAKLHFAPFFVG